MAKFNFDRMRIKEIFEGRHRSGLPTVHVSNRGTLVCQGPEVRKADGLVLKRGERAVELSPELLRAVLRAFDE